MPILLNAFAYIIKSNDDKKEAVEFLKNLLTIAAEDLKVKGFYENELSLEKLKSDLDCFSS